MRKLGEKKKIFISQNSGKFNFWGEIYGIFFLLERFSIVQSWQITGNSYLDIRKEKIYRNILGFLYVYVS